MTDYTDLIARLRSEAETAAYAIEPAAFYLDAAAAIAALTAERDALRGALQEIADTHNEQWHAGRIARAALTPKG